MLIDVRRASFGYGGRAVVTVDRLQLHAGRCLGIFGPNGAGKTTLIRGVTGLLPPVAGEIIRSPGTGGAGAPLTIAYLPQSRSMELHWPMTGLDAAAMATSARRRFGWIGRSAMQKVHASMQKLDVASLANRPYANLSGGQQQRLLLAGALAADPSVLVLDEPTDGLDVRSTHRLLDLLGQLTTDGLCTVMISHEVENLLQICHEVAWLHAADLPGQPSQIEIISPAELADRILSGRRGG